MATLAFRETLAAGFVREAFDACFAPLRGAFFELPVPFRAVFRGGLFLACRFPVVVAPFRLVAVVRFFARTGFAPFFNFTLRAFVGFVADFAAGLRFVFLVLTFRFPSVWRVPFTLRGFGRAFFFAGFFTGFLEDAFFPDDPGFFAFFPVSRDDLVRLLAAIFRPL